MQSKSRHSQRTGPQCLWIHLYLIFQIHASYVFIRNQVLRVVGPDHSCGLDALRVAQAMFRGSLRRSAAESDAPISSVLASVLQNIPADQRPALGHVEGRAGYRKSASAARRAAGRSFGSLTPFWDLDVLHAFSQVCPNPYFVFDSQVRSSGGIGKRGPQALTACSRPWLPCLSRTSTPRWTANASWLATTAREPTGCCCSPRGHTWRAPLHTQPDFPTHDVTCLQMQPRFLRSLRSWASTATIASLPHRWSWPDGHGLLPQCVARSASLHPGS